MPRYSYTAKSLKGEEKSGITEVKDERQLSKTLREQGFILIKAELETAEKKRKFKISLPFLGGVSLTEKLMFTRNLQVMISAGLPLPRALETLASQTKSKKFKKALLNINEEIIKGKNFSDSLKAHPDIFSELFQSMIKVGEETGNLEEVLRTLSQQIEKENELKSKIKGALMYPAVIVSAMIGIGILMLVMVVPKLAETFEELNIELPFTTRMVIGLGNFLAEKWFLVLLIMAVFLFFFRLALKTRRGKEMIDAITLKIPIISPLIKKTNSAHTVRTLSSLISAGVPIVSSLNIVAGILGNIHYKTALLQVAEKVKKGEKLSDAMAPYKEIYPLIVMQMIKVGEETGETSDILAKLAIFFEEEIGYATKNLTSVIEPILMLIVGGAIGFFAISMIQPMYSMLEAIE
ncbi:MAG: type II secretion system F family protein [Candidatus Nealsonbacteria bacterium]|nr:type II secretion system F family protein [Candidatus Nealsonbacteria bacterium]